MRFACTAEVPPADLFQGIQLSEGEEEGSRVLMDDLGIAAVSKADRQTDKRASVHAWVVVLILLKAIVLITAVCYPSLSPPPPSLQRVIPHSPLPLHHCSVLSLTLPSPSITAACYPSLPPPPPPPPSLQDSPDGRATIFTGEEEAFAAQRVMSRLVEMQTDTYWELAVHERRRDSPSS